MQKMQSIVRNKVFSFMSRYYEEFVLVLFGIGLCLYGFGLDLGVNFKTQGFFQIGGLLYIIFAYKRFALRDDLRLLGIPLISFGVVIVLGLLSYFDEIMPRSFGKVFGSVNTHIIKYLVLFVIVFLYVRYAKRRNVLILFGIFGLLCMVNVVASLVEFWRYDFRTHRVPFGFKAVFTYNIWLLAPMALCISGVVACKHKVLKILCVLGVILTLGAMFANGERSFLVASLVMMFVPFVVWRYRHKGKILPLVFIVGVLALGGIYTQTKTLPDRYNFAHMIDNFWEVIQTPVVEMGKYDKLCFNGFFACNPQSTKNGEAEFFWEHSSLSRIAMSKSTFEAFLDSPFTPRIVGVFQIGEYLWQYYEVHTDKQANRMYVSVDNPKHNGYNSPHNFAVSMLFCYGIIGFVAILVFLGFVFYTCYKQLASNAKDSTRDFVPLWAFVCLVGICTQGFFDVLYPNILEVLFIFLGAVVGFCRAKVSIHLNCRNSQNIFQTPPTTHSSILLTIGDISIIGGAERVVVNLANLFVQLGHSVEIVSFFRANPVLPYTIDERVRVRFFYPLSEGRLKDTNALKRFYIKNIFKFVLSMRVWWCHRVDYVIANDWTYTPFLKHKNTKYIKILHTNFTRYNKRNNYFDTLVLLSYAEIALYRSFHKHIKVIPNFLPTTPIQCTDYSQKIVLSVGRMDNGDQKGFLRLIDIWEQVSQMDGASGWKLYIVGDGAIKEQIQAKIQAKNLEQGIVLCPFTTDIESMYLSASIYVMSSHYEGFGMVLIESGSYGLAAIAFDVATGPSDIIVDSRTGYLVADNDVQDYAHKLHKLMCDENLRSTFGLYAKKRVQEYFSKEAITSLWEEMLGGKQHTQPMSENKQQCIGIVVPVYNVESYLIRCLDSIIAQSYENFVIVLVNDASTDSSREICLTYQSKDKRIIFVDAVFNNGQASVRNKALDILDRGGALVEEVQATLQDVMYTQLLNIPVVDYVMFVDSDDYISPNALEIIITDFEHNDVDICVYNNHYVAQESTEAIVHDYKIFSRIRESRVYIPTELMQHNPRGFVTTACMFVYRAPFLCKHRLRFIESILYEDVPFCTQSILFAQNVYVSFVPWYYYFLSPTSTTRGAMDANKRRKSFESWIRILQFFIMYLEESKKQDTTHNHNTQDLVVLQEFYARNIKWCFKRIFELLCVSGGYGNGISKQELKPYVQYMRGKYHLYYHIPTLRKFL
ncbi:glycosyltransferase [Helicobacter equorum]|uniref:glycosyltransferase n=1 Tax=Helicobacter equorum TaxID=361872 RepID=UPI001315ADE6|nr:glycosyltransferase [Helicobacter equorum]